MVKREKPVVFYKKVGLNGRLVIPQDLRIMFGIETDTLVKVTLSDEGIYIQPVQTDELPKEIKLEK